MKKVISTMLALGMIVSAASCTASESSRKSIVSVESSDTEKATKEVKDDSKTDSDTEKETKSEEKPDSSNNDTADFTIDEQVIWEADGVKLTAQGVDTDSLFGTSIKVLAENNSDKDIVINTDAVIVNNYMIADLGYIEVTAGNKVNDEISLSSTDLKNAGIDNIGQIELYLHTSDPDTYDRISESGCITLKTSDFDKMDTESNIQGSTLVDQDGIKVIAQYVDEDSFWGAAVLFYMENNTDKKVTVIADDTAVNGFMVDGSCYQELYPNKKAIASMDFFSSDLEGNGITSIDEVELKFRVTDDDYNTLLETDKLKFATK